MVVAMSVFLVGVLSLHVVLAFYLAWGFCSDATMPMMLSRLVVRKRRRRSRE